MAEKQANQQPECRSTQERRQAVKMNEVCALRADLERTNRRHPHAAASAGPLSVGPLRFLCRTPVDQVRPTAARTSSATGTEAIRNRGDRNDHGVTALDWL